jgi:hypothetical protein
MYKKIVRMEVLRILVCIKFRFGNTLWVAGTLKSAGQFVHPSDNDFTTACSCSLELCVTVSLCRSEFVVQNLYYRWTGEGERRSRYMDEKPRIVAYKLIIDANIVKHKGRTERQNIVHAMEGGITPCPTHMASSISIGPSRLRVFLPTRLSRALAVWGIHSALATCGYPVSHNRGNLLPRFRCVPHLCELENAGRRSHIYFVCFRDIFSYLQVLC